MTLRSLALIACLSTSMSATAQSVEPPHEAVVSSQKQPIPNIAGKNLVASVIDYRPGAKAPSHRYPHARLVCAHVLSGAIRSGVKDEPATVYRTGESWFELPGAHQKARENESVTEPARLLVIFVVDADNSLITADP